MSQTPKNPKPSISGASSETSGQSAQVSLQKVQIPEPPATNPIRRQKTLKAGFYDLVKFGHERVLAFDPGETTGVVSFLPDSQDQPVFHYCTQVTGIMTETEAREEGIEVDSKKKMKADVQVVVRRFDNIFNMIRPTIVVMEDYFIYANKLKQHLSSDLFTTRIIGAIEGLAGVRNIPVVMHSASQAKGFVTDEKLKAWQMYEVTKGQRHARDALRHAVY